MMTLLGALLGFVGSALPEGLKLYRDHRDKAHEVTLLQLQMKWSQLKHDKVIQAIEAQGLSDEVKAIYRHAQPVGVPWVDALAGLVRPLITYAFFIMYGCVKYGQWILLATTLADLYDGHHGVRALLHIWNEEDQALFAAVMSFWFGQRALFKKTGA